MARSFVGTNNINTRLPIGQFGTRLQGGTDSASPRYIFTKLSPVTRTLFHPDDDAVLRFLSEDSEPEWYCPIIPMVLVNGASGVGTGWSTNIPNYNPKDIIDILFSQRRRKATPGRKRPVPETSSFSSATKARKSSSSVSTPVPSLRKSSSSASSSKRGSSSNGNKASRSSSASSTPKKAVKKSPVPVVSMGTRRSTRKK